MWHHSRTLLTPQSAMGLESSIVSGGRRALLMGPPRNPGDTGLRRHAAPLFTENVSPTASVGATHLRTVMTWNNSLPRQGASRTRRIYGPCTLSDGQPHDGQFAFAGAASTITASGAELPHLTIGRHRTTQDEPWRSDFASGDTSRLLAASIHSIKVAPLIENALPRSIYVADLSGTMRTTCTTLMFGVAVSIRRASSGRLHAGTPGNRWCSLW